MAEVDVGRLEQDVANIKVSVDRLEQGQAALSERMARLEGGFTQMDRRMSNVEQGQRDLVAALRSGHRWLIGLVLFSWLSLVSLLLSGLARLP